MCNCRNIQVKITKDNKEIPLPRYATIGSSGMDLKANIQEPITIKPLQRVIVPTGIRMELPNDTEVQVRPRSGLSIKHGITLINCIGTIDEDYRGDIGVPLVNLSDKEYTIQPGERIAQAVFMPVLKATLNEVDSLSDTVRGEGGFGSTGSN
jgi:dUTP pyrophosphatase